MRDQEKQDGPEAAASAPAELQNAPVQFQSASALQSAELMGLTDPIRTDPRAAQSDNVARANAAVQAHGGQSEGANVHAVAQQGVSGGGGALPHLDRIQSSFGAHDVSGIEAHVGGKAADATSAIGAQAYATGNDVAFGSAPDLHTAAHEAAHVVQQRSGVSLKGGVGQSGDAYEQHADHVADRVVAGKSAEGLLNEMAGGGTRQAVQRQEGDEEETDDKTKDGDETQDAGGQEQAGTENAGDTQEPTLTKEQMILEIGKIVANPKDSTLRQTYETGVRNLSTRAQSGVTALGIAIAAFDKAKISKRKGAIPLPKADDAKLEPLARELNAARTELSTNAKSKTPRPLLHYIFVANLARYDTQYGPSYEFLTDTEQKNNAQVIGGACRPNPSINKFLSKFTDWLAGQGEATIAEYYDNMQNGVLGN